MRFAHKASSRPSHARVPGFTRRPASSRQPAVATLVRLHHLCVMRNGTRRRARAVREAQQPLAEGLGTAQIQLPDVQVAHSAVLQGANDVVDRILA